MRSLIEDGDRVYVLDEIEAKRSVNPKASRKANDSMGEDSWIEDINGIMVNYVTDGISVNTLVFYF